MEPIVDPSWLAARVAADTSARAATIDTLLSELISYVSDPRVPAMFWRSLILVLVQARTSAGSQHVCPSGSAGFTLIMIL